MLVEIKVQDYGIGMNEEDINNLFKPYFKTTDEKSR
jgi:signal transduction histidine kinase